MDFLIEFGNFTRICLFSNRPSTHVLLHRLFNDGPTMLLAYAASALLLLRRWVPAIVVFSAAVSVKMNVLLMAPSVLLIVLKVCRLAFCTLWGCGACQSGGERRNPAHGGAGETLFWCTWLRA